MTTPDFTYRIQSITDTCRIHLDRMQYALDFLQNQFPLDAGSIQEFSLEQISRTDQLIYRFSQLQDTMGGKLFPLILEGLGEPAKQIPFIDILNRLEQLSIIDSADHWIILREIRNAISHEYPDNEKAMAEGLNELHVQAGYIRSLLDKILEFARIRGWLHE